MAQILLIDDEKELREMLAIVLEETGYSVLTASDGVEGVDLAKSHLPDLIICDVSMPRLDGFRTFERLREDPATASIPFIFLTAHGDLTHMRTGMNLGADDYIPKPVAADELLRAIDSRLKKQRSVSARMEQKLNELRANISAALPHELRTPLNAILGFAELLRTEAGKSSSDEVVMMATQIEEAAGRLHHALENFIAFAQLQVIASDPVTVAQLRKSRVEKGGAMIEHVARSRARWHGREEDVAVSVAQDAIAIEEKHLVTIVSELTDNALKFSEKGSPINVRSTVENGKLVLTVKDQGRGMTADQIADVGAYMQFDRKKYEQQGFGLGLAIAQKLTELYDGSFSLKSVPGKGTSVTLSLPLAAPSDA